MTTGAVAGNLLILDATSVPADGAVTPKYCYPWPATSGSSVSWPNGARFQTGIVAVFSSAASCFTKTASATAFFSAQVAP